MADVEKSPDEKIGETSLAPVVTGKVSVKPKSEGKKILETFFKGNLDTVRRGVWLDVVVPTVMDMLWSALERAGRGLIYGDNDGYSRRDRDRGSIPSTRVDFTAYSKRDRDRRRDDRDTYSDAASDVYDYGEVRFEYDRGPDEYSREDARRDAERVLAKMEDTIDEYRWISVGQMFDLIRVPRKYTDSNYGWRDLRNAGITTGRNCYILKLPKPRSYD